ncbi:MAG: hypothetical protein JST85_17010 [Acidobacteria bacterium]|nr:hypothetical protein [Acidobacteriota bacterium]
MNRRISIIVFFVFTAFFLSIRLSSAHDPITTKVMFNKEVIRILERNCLGCHAPNKIKADIPLTNYDEARPWAKAIKEEVLEKRMMPFQAVKGYGRFQHDYVLTQRETELLVSWIEGGAPRGDTKDYPAQRIDQLVKGEAWLLGEPDLTLQAPETKIAAEAEGEPESETRCIALATGLRGTHWLSAIDFHPGNGEIVQSASLHVVNTKPISPNVKMSACGRIGKTLGVWVPGQSATRFPEGVGRELKAGEEFILQVRYQKTEQPATDSSRVALYFAKTTATKSVRTETIAPESVVIPANADNQQVRASMLISRPSEAISIRPLLFPFAKSVEARAVRPDGSIEVLVVARNYRFDWQPAYFFKQPVSLPRGTRIEVIAYVDNSDKNRNQPNDPPVELKLDSPLCEIALAQPSKLKPAR